VAGAPSPFDIVRGVGVWLVAIACYMASGLIFAVSDPAVAHVLASEDWFPGAPPSAAAVVLVSVVNPVFEEFLWLGYGVTRLSPRIGVRAASALSIGLRALVHLYQGPGVLVGVLPLSVGLTWYYVRTRRLWPVVVAHALFDASGLVYRMSTP
jgi:membrane protease YdiL (CAAX protease family)